MKRPRWFWIIVASAIGIGQFGLLEKAGAQTPAECSLKEVVDLREQVLRLQESLALANADAAAFRKQWEDLQLRNRALGVDALTVDEKKLEDRVVEAVKELYQADQDRRVAVNRLQQLIDAGEGILKTAHSIDPQSRSEYEIAVRAAQDFLKVRNTSEIPLAADLTQGQIVHVNGELGSVIVNLGSTLGVKAGMPFRVLRKDRIIGRLKAFEVRDNVCAALVDSTEKGIELKAGDHVVVAAEK